MTGLIECPCCVARFEYDLDDTEVTFPECGVMMVVGRAEIAGPIEVPNPRMCFKLTTKDGLF